MRMGGVFVLKGGGSVASIWIGVGSWCIVWGLDNFCTAFTGHKRLHGRTQEFMQSMPQGQLNISCCFLMAGTSMVNLDHEVQYASRGRQNPDFSSPSKYSSFLTCAASRSLCLTYLVGMVYVLKDNLHNLRTRARSGTAVQPCTILVWRVHLPRYLGT